MLISIRKLISTFLVACKVKLGHRIPIRVTHIITNRCNLKCPYCYANQDPSLNEMPTDQVFMMMDEFRAMGTKVWKIGGGEPLLRHDIDDIVSYAVKKGFVINMDTNGYFVPKHLDLFKKLTIIQLSLDGPESVHDLVRGKGAHKKVVEAIKALHSIKKKPMIHCVLSKNNPNVVDYLDDFSREYDVMLNFQPAVAVHKSAEDQGMRPEQIIDELRKIKRKKNTNTNYAISTQFIDHMVSYYENNDAGSFRKKLCYAGRMYILINPYGELVRCMPSLGSSGNSGLLHPEGFRGAFQDFNCMKKCDCTFACFYDMTNLYSMRSDYVIRAVVNLLRNRHIYY